MWAPRAEYLYKTAILIIAILFASARGGTNVAPTSPNCRIRSEWLSEYQWRCTISVDQPAITTRENNTQILLDGLETQSIPGHPEIPHFTILLNAPPGEIQIQVQPQNPVVYPLTAPVSVFNDISKPDGQESSQTAGADPFKSSQQYPAQLYQLNFVGNLLNTPLTQLTITPIQLIDNGAKLRYYQEMTILVTLQKTTQSIETSLNQSQSVFRALFPTQKTLRRRVPKLAGKAVVQNLPLNTPLMRLAVDKDGIYRIYRIGLIDSGAVLKNSDPRSFQLFNNGSEIPIYVHGESDGSFDRGDYIEFYGKRHRNSVANYEYDPFTDKNVYFLIWDQQQGIRYVDEPARPTVPENQAISSRDFYYTLHYEINRHFDRLGRVDVNKPSHVRDHWFFDSGIPGGTTRSYFFDIPHPNQNTIKEFDIEVGLHGLTYQPSAHVVTIYINDNYAGSGSWNDQQPHIIYDDAQQKLENRILRSRDNKIQIAVAGDDPTNKYDKVLFDWLKIRYHRLYRAEGDRIDMYKPPELSPGLYHFNIDNFSDPEIVFYKVGRSKLVNFEVTFDRRSDSYAVRFEDRIEDENIRYVGASRLGVMTPAVLRPDTLVGLARLTVQTELIIITKDRWKQRLKRLLDLYADLGISAQVVSVRDIYNEFNHGIVSPYAIKAYIRYAHDNWIEPPDYILLIGDAAIREEESVPAFYFQSYKFGACAADHWYVALDDQQHLPAAAIGRWPATTVEELQTLIDNRIRYAQQAPLDPWKNELLFIAGKEDVFKDQSENMITRQISKEFDINRIYINPSARRTPYWGGSDTLISHFNRGIALGNFMGHGGGAVWADRSLFNSSHIPLLDNLDRLPFLTSMTCFTGDFANMTGLGEHLLLAENGGAIGLWGSSSVGWIKNDYLLAKPFYDAILAPGLTVGEAIQVAKVRYLAEMSPFDYLKLSLVYPYNLIGDPTVKIPFPEEKTTLQMTPTAPTPGEKVTLHGSLPFENGTLFLQLHNADRFKVWSQPSQFPFTASDFSCEFRLPSAIQESDAYVNYYLTDDSHDGHGATLIDIGGLTFYGLEITPATPQVDVPIRIAIYTEDGNLDSLICELDTLSATRYLDDNGIEQISAFQDLQKIIRLEMISQADSSNRWQTIDSIRIGTPGKWIGIRFRAVDRNGRSTLSENHAIRIQPIPDIYPVSIRQGGEKFPAIIAEIFSDADQPLQTMVNAYRYNPAGDPIQLASGSFTLLANRKTPIHLPTVLGKGFEKYQITVDPDNIIRESNELNNSYIDSFRVQVYPLLPELGSSYDGIRHDTLGFAEYYYLAIPPNSVTDSCALRIVYDSLAANPRQPDVNLLSPDAAQQAAMGLTITPLGTLPELALPAVIRCDPDSGLALNENITIGVYDPALKIWLGTESRVVGHSVTTLTNRIGALGLLEFDDREPPVIEISIEGQELFHNPYVPRQPNISILAEDQNGVRFTPDGLEVCIDENEISFDRFTLADSLANGNHISARFRPNIEPGEHTLEVKICDAAGNQASRAIDFTVSAELKLIDYGNYPNPFKDRTTFIYELTQRVDKFKINIYTVSGRLVISLRKSDIFTTGWDMNASGYHEITWDGLDANGNFVANGVYFYKIIAQKDDRKMSSIGKIAKAR